MKLYLRLLAIGIIFTISISCESDEVELDYGQSVPGTWFQEGGEMINPDLSYRNEILFRNDGSYEESFMVVEIDNPENIVGYYSLMVGEYELIDNVLRRFNIEQYGLDNTNEYLDREGLLLEESGIELQEVELLLNKSADQLTIDYCLNGPCPPYVSYLEFQTYFRSN